MIPVRLLPKLWHPTKPRTTSAVLERLSRPSIQATPTDQKPAPQCLPHQDPRHGSSTSPQAHCTAARRHPALGTRPSPTRRAANASTSVPCRRTPNCQKRAASQGEIYRGSTTSTENGASASPATSRRSAARPGTGARSCLRMRMMAVPELNGCRITRIRVRWGDSAVGLPRRQRCSAGVQKKRRLRKSSCSKTDVVAGPSTGSALRRLKWHLSSTRKMPRHAA